MATGRGISQYLFIVVALCGVTTCSAATVNGSVTGTVVDDTGKPVSGARVVISYALPSTETHLDGPPIITGAFAASVISDKTGAFVVDQLRAGSYVACSQTLAPGLLDPCRWGKSAPEFTVVAGKATAGVAITMARGAVIPIHVDDPKGLLKKVTSAFDYECQFHIVTDKGIHYNANIQASNGAGRDYSFTVPFGAAVTLKVVSPHLAVNDATGKAVGDQDAGSINAAPGSVAATSVFAITGAK